MVLELESEDLRTVFRVGTSAESLFPVFLPFAALGPGIQAVFRAGGETVQRDWEVGQICISVVLPLIALAFLWATTRAKGRIGMPAV